MLRSVLGFILRFFVRSFTRVMGCFFACFRIRDTRRNYTPHCISISKRSNVVATSRNSSASLLSEEDRDDSSQIDGMGFQGDFQGLNDEAKFLKACGTLAGTPIEIRKASEKLKTSPSPDQDSDPSRFHSWLPNTSVDKLQSHVQPFDPPTPVKLCEKGGNSMDSFEHTPSSCISTSQDTQDDSTDYTEKSCGGNLHTEDRFERNAALVSPLLVTNTQRKSKFVRFESETDLVSYGSTSDDWHMKENKSPNNQSAYKQSPYPTPLKLFDEMKTPGTVYPTPLEELRSGKAHVRSQFVYPTNNQGDNVFRCQILEDRDFNPEEDSSEQSDLVDQSQNGTPTPEEGLKKFSNGYEDEEKSNLSSRLTPLSIIEEHSPISLKWWYGNGIPNSTTKYKEDQKVNWHATPFEERLDKALSENFISQRKLVHGKPVEFDGIEEK